MSAVLPRGKKKSGVFIASSEAQRKKESRSEKSKIVTNSRKVVPFKYHPWSGVGGILLAPLPSDWQLKIQHALR